jgi:hypothetical protein
MSSFVPYLLIWSAPNHAGASVSNTTGGHSYYVCNSNISVSCAVELSGLVKSCYCLNNVYAVSQPQSEPMLLYSLILLQYLQWLPVP